MTTTWNDAEKAQIRALVAEGKDSIYIGNAFHRTPGAVRSLAKRMGLSFASRTKKQEKEAKKSIADSTSAEDRLAARQRLREEEHRQVRKKYEEVLRDQTLDDMVIDIFRDELGKAYGEKFTINIRPTKQKLNSASVAEEAVLVISDTHVGKLVEPNETNGFGLYNPLRFLAKLQHLENTVAHIIEEKNKCPIGNPVQKLHVMLLGDLVDGMLNHAEEIPGHTYVSQQVHLAALAFFQTISRLALVVDEVAVYGVGGNHARWPNQKKPPTTGRFSNLDTIVLEWLQSLFCVSPVKNVTFRLERSLHQIIDILGTRICVSHGDHLRGGDKAMGVPIHAIAREINSMTQRLAARMQPVPRYYIVADKHKRIELPTARGSFMVNGAFPGTDGYSISGGFSETLPEQLFFGLHPRIGKSWSYNLNVGDEMVPAAKLSELSYCLPESVQNDLAKFE